MRPSLHLAAALLLFSTGAPAQFHLPHAKHDSRPHTDAEWMWQYGPPPTDGRENELIQDPHFLPFLEANLTSPQTFWGGPETGSQTGFKPLSSTAYDFLAVPGKVLADDNRYLTVTGCVFHFCSDRGLLWVDLNAREPLVAFAAIDWTRESKPPTDPAAEYTLWLFANRSFGTAPDAPNHIPAALTHSLARWATEPAVRTHIVQYISHVILVDPDGTPHQIDPATLNIPRPAALKSQPAPSESKP